MTEFNEGEINHTYGHSFRSAYSINLRTRRKTGRKNERKNPSKAFQSSRSNRQRISYFLCKEAGLSETRIYHLLADPDSFVNQEVHRILNDLFGDLAGTWGTWGNLGTWWELGVSPGNHEAFSNRFLKDTNVRSLCVSTLRDACVTLDTSPICNF
jgi:hypothetical protein